MTTNALGTQLQPASCGVDEVLTFDALGAFLCKSVASIINGGNFLAGDGTELAPSVAFTNDTGTGLYRPADNLLGISVAGSEKVRIEDNGRVGIGTKTPESLLHLHNEFGNVSLQMTGKTGAGFINLQGDALQKRTIIAGNDSRGWVGTTSDNGSIPFVIKTNDTDRIFIKPLGNVGIENNDPQYTLDVTGDINASGAVSANGVALTSDKRFKKNIHPLVDSLTKILKLRGSTYYWKREEYPEKKFPEGLHYGVIAQDVQKVFPELVETGKDEHLRVNYPGLVAPVIESVRELHQEDKKIGRKLATLEEENRKLREENEKMKKDLILIRKKLGL